jgi:MFS family permease
MVSVAALSQNVATGLLFGTFGTILFALEERFAADRGQSSLTISLAVVSLSLTAAWLGTRMGRVSLRTAMVMGAALGGSGFALLIVSSQLWQLWAIYLLLLGPGAGLMGVLAANTLAAQWTPEAKRGRALGWVNAPLIVTLAPLASEAIMKTWGLNALFGLLALVQLAMIPILLRVREASQTPVATTEGDGLAGMLTPLLFSLVMIVGIITGGGLLKLSNMLPLVTAQGHSFSAANLLLAISGFTGIIGSLLFGWLADRFNPARALALNAGLQAMSWTILLVPVAYPLLVLDAVVVGMCGGGLQAVIGALLGRLYGQNDFARIFGALSLLTLPFLFAIPWLAGVLFVSSGGYLLPIALQIAGFVVAGIGALTLGRWETQDQP